MSGEMLPESNNLRDVRVVRAAFSAIFGFFSNYYAGILLHDLDPSHGDYSKPALIGGLLLGAGWAWEQIHEDKELLGIEARQEMS